MRFASIIMLVMLGPLLLGQERDSVLELSAEDSITVSAMDSTTVSAMDSTAASALDSSTVYAADSATLAAEDVAVDSAAIPPEVSLDQNPLISTGVSAEIPVRRVEPLPEASQEPTLVKYTTDFKFGDGIYANFDMVLANDPIPAARIVTDLDMFDRDFYEKITTGKEIVIYDRNGVKKELPTQDIWGYGRNGVLYINVGSAFHRISLVGSICHFVATVTTYNPNYYDPYYYNPYYSSSYYYNRYSMPRSNVASTDLRQYLLDFQTGDVMEYETESVEVLMMKDPELADEYHALSNRKKKQMKFVFIRRYNEKHPLYLPAR